MGLSAEGGKILKFVEETWSPSPSVIIFGNPATISNSTKKVTTKNHLPHKSPHNQFHSHNIHLYLKKKQELCVILTPIIMTLFTFERCSRNEEKKRNNFPILCSF
jgi:hypothetical protein